MRYYPLFLNITKMNCLVLGAGKVGRRKIASLQKAGAQGIYVIDLFLSKENFMQLFLDEYGYKPCITYSNREFLANDLENIRIAFAATASSEMNGKLAELCHERHILCNVIEDTWRGDFLVPAHIDFDNLIVALSTSGASPAFSRVLKQDMETWLDCGYAPFLRLMEQVRAYLLQNKNPFWQNSETRIQIFRAFVAKEMRTQILQFIKNEDNEGVCACVEQILTEFALKSTQENIQNNIIEPINIQNILDCSNIFKKEKIYRNAD